MSVYREVPYADFPAIAAASAHHGIQVSSWVGRSEGGGGWNTIRAVAQAHLYLTPQTAQPSQWFLEWSHWIRLYFYVLFGVPTRLIHLRLQDAKSEHDYPDVEYVFQQTLLRRRRKYDLLRIHCGKFPEGAKGGLCAWLDRRSDLEPSVHALAAADFLSRSATGRFLGYMNGLEVLHRRIRGTTLVGPSDFDVDLRKMTGAMPLDVSPVVRARALEMLQYSNEPSLRKRLDELVEEVGSEVGRALHLDESYRRRMARTRNYYAHYSADPGGAFQDLALVDAAERARALLVALLLRLAGMSPSLVVECLRRGRDTMGAATSAPRSD